MGEARSQALIQLSGAAGHTSAEFVCPADHITLVKSVYVQNFNAASAAFRLGVATSSGQVDLAVITEVLAANAIAGFTPWVVLNPGNVALLVCEPGVFGWVSGAILNGANQFPVAS